LLVDYDYATASKTLTPSSFRGRIDSMWKYHELLPPVSDANRVSLGEGGTSLLAAKRLGEMMGFSRLFLKDESTNPTGSFKARGLSMAVSRAKELGLKRLIIPTAGNAGSALSAYCARGGLEAKVVMPSDSPAPFKVDCIFHGADVELRDGTIADSGKRVGELVKEEGWFSVATLKEPYRIEGKKTMGYEIAEQFDFDLPEVIVYPTGGGTGLIGMWKAFDEMEKLGWIKGRRPRMISVQMAECAPIPRAFADGAEQAMPWESPQTVVAGLRVPSAVGDFLILEAVRTSGGEAVSVTDEEAIEGTRLLASCEGIFAAPEAGAAVAGLKVLLATKKVRPEERVVVFVTGSGYKYLDVLEQGLGIP
jgi:threonine synthase